MKRNKIIYYMANVLLPFFMLFSDGMYFFNPKTNKLNE